MIGITIRKLFDLVLTLLKNKEYLKDFKKYLNWLKGHLCYYKIIRTIRKKYGNPIYLIRPELFSKEALKKFKETFKEPFLKDTLSLLYEEQLDNGTWAKTYIWRKKDNKPLPEVGTLTGTFHVLDILLYGKKDRIGTVRRHNELKKTLREITTRDGELRRKKEITRRASHGTSKEEEYFEPRHQAAGFLTRLLVFNDPDPVDEKIIENLIKKNKKFDYFDISFLIKSILAYMIEERKIKLEYIKNIENFFDKVFKHIEENLKSEDIFKAKWGELAQWLTLWHFLPVFEFYHLAGDKRIKKMLPRIYKWMEMTSDDDLSICALIIKILTLFYLLNKAELLKSKKENSKEYLIKKTQESYETLIKKIKDKDTFIEESENFDLKEPLGYFNFSMVIALGYVLQIFKPEWLEEIGPENTKITEKYNEVIKE